TKPADSDPDDVDESKLTPPRKDENEFPAVDPQVEVALNLMRIRLESGMDWPTAPEQIAATPAAK
ncbi:MAG: hypothetical protein HY718_20760, partial [Planctomycetes bacterium]|nr:hypothetical protein [Planctomycetota bacterium]